MADKPQQQSSLYVGDLAPDATEANLFDVFREVGPVLSIRVCRDAISRRSLGYAYVNFQNPVDAAKALETLNFSKIRGRPCRIMWCRRDPSLRKSAKNNIFIKDLAPNIDNKALHDTFTAFGNILSCKVVTDEQGNSKGYGFVHFEKEESAADAVAKVNGMLLNSKQVFVGHFERKEKKIKDLQKTFTNCYVKHISKEATDDAVKAFFAKFGEISSCLVKRDAEGKALFAFVNYKEHEGAAKAVAEVNGAKEGAIVTAGKPLLVTRHQRKDERDHLRRQKARERAQQYSKFSNLYIKNLDDSVNTPMLRESFAEFGSIVSARVMTHGDTQISKGFGFVCFREAEAANKAVQAMNGRIFCGKPLYVALAQRKEQRRAQLELFYRSGRSPFTGGAQAGGSTMGIQAAPFGGASRGGGGMGFGSRGRGGVRPGASRGGMRAAQNVVQMVPMQYGGQPMGMGIGMQQPRMMPAPMHQGMPMQQRAPQQMPVQQPTSLGSSGVDPSRLVAMSHEAQKNLLGEKLFAKISEQDQDNAAKITGMLLEMDNSEIINLLDSPDLLKGKVAEANQVLREHAMN